MNSCSLVWFRRDLRLSDNPALSAATKRAAAIIPVFIWDPADKWPPGAASKWWLHQSLLALDTTLRERGLKLILRKGNSVSELQRLARETRAKAIFWNRCYEPSAVTEERAVEEVMREAGIEVHTSNSSLLYDPGTILNKSGEPFKVFTAFWKRCLSQPPQALPATTPRKFTPPDRWPASVPLETLELEPKVDWAAGMREHWQPGEHAAQKRLRMFLKNIADNYGDRRNRPDLDGTSQLSPHLHFGEISPLQIWEALRKRAGDRDQRWTHSQFVAELGWREFAHHLLFHFPQMPDKPLRPEFEGFRWRNDPAHLEAWQKGRTGYPIVDAGMRQLWQIGWMHNRVRMIVGSFLVKDLLQPWQQGERWFWDTLVDADLANNSMGWQWIAGCGADAAPFFRIFNPITQGEKFDPRGDYVRRWVPELADMPNKWIHKPFQAPPEILARAKVRLGDNYPELIVNHSIAREVALEAFHRLRSAVT